MRGAATSIRSRAFSTPVRRGELVVAYLEDRPVGTVALRALDRRRSEMKRLFVSDAARGLGLGDQLVETIIVRARQFGFDEMMLDTGFKQNEATRLYLKHGFKITAPYYDVDERLAAGGLTFMRKSLGDVNA